MTDTGFFEETAGVKSLMRLMSFMVLIFFFAYNTFCLVKGVPVDETFNLILIVAAFFPKLLQKIVEVKFPALAATGGTDVSVATSVKVTDQK